VSTSAGTRLASGESRSASIEKVTPAIEALGGRVERGYFAFGEHDLRIELVG
jgi:uncharacterized protein with GYD domain